MLNTKFLRKEIDRQFDGNVSAFARSAGTARNNVNRALSGEDNPTVATLVTWAKALGCSIEDLLSVDNSGARPANDRAPLAMHL